MSGRHGMTTRSGLRVNGNPGDEGTVNVKITPKYQKPGRPKKNEQPKNIEFTIQFDNTQKISPTQPLVLCFGDVQKPWSSEVSTPTTSRQYSYEKTPRQSFYQEVYSDNESNNSCSSTDSTCIVNLKKKSEEINKTITLLLEKKKLKKHSSNVVQVGNPPEINQTNLSRFFTKEQDVVTTSTKHSDYEESTPLDTGQNQSLFNPESNHCNYEKHVKANSSPLIVRPRIKKIVADRFLPDSHHRNHSINVPASPEKVSSQMPNHDPSMREIMESLEDDHQETFSKDTPRMTDVRLNRLAKSGGLSNKLKTLAHTLLNIAETSSNSQFEAVKEVLRETMEKITSIDTENVHLSEKESNSRLDLIENDIDSYVEPTATHNLSGASLLNTSELDAEAHIPNQHASEKELNSRLDLIENDFDDNPNSFVESTATHNLGGASLLNSLELDAEAHIPNQQDITTRSILQSMSNESLVQNEKECNSSLPISSATYEAVMPRGQKTIDQFFKKISRKTPAASNFSLPLPDEDLRGSRPAASPPACLSSPAHASSSFDLQEKEVRVDNAKCSEESECNEDTVGIRQQVGSKEQRRVVKCKVLKTRRERTNSRHHIPCDSSSEEECNNLPSSKKNRTSVTENVLNENNLTNTPCKGNRNSNDELPSANNKVASSKEVSNKSNKGSKNGSPSTVLSESLNFNKKLVAKLRFNIASLTKVINNANKSIPKKNHENMEIDPTPSSHTQQAPVLNPSILNKKQETSECEETCLKKDKPVPVQGTYADEIQNTQNNSSEKHTLPKSTNHPLNRICYLTPTKPAEGYEENLNRNGTVTATDLAKSDIDINTTVQLASLTNRKNKSKITDQVMSNSSNDDEREVGQKCTSPDIFSESLPSNSQTNYTSSRRVIKPVSADDSSSDSSIEEQSKAPKIDKPSLCDNNQKTWSVAKKGDNFSHGKDSSSDSSIGEKSKAPKIDKPSHSDNSQLSRSTTKKGENFSHGNDKKANTSNLSKSNERNNLSKCQKKSSPVRVAEGISPEEDSSSDSNECNPLPPEKCHPPKDSNDPEENIPSLKAIERISSDSDSTAESEVGKDNSELITPSNVSCSPLKMKPVSEPPIDERLSSEPDEESDEHDHREVNTTFVDIADDASEKSVDEDQISLNEVLGKDGDEEPMVSEPSEDSDETEGQESRPGSRLVEIENISIASSDSEYLTKEETTNQQPAPQDLNESALCFALSQPIASLTRERKDSGSSWLESMSVGAYDNGTVYDSTDSGIRDGSSSPNRSINFVKKSKKAVDGIDVASMDRDALVLQYLSFVDKKEKKSKRFRRRSDASETQESDSQSLLQGFSLKKKKKKRVIEEEEPESLPVPKKKTKKGAPNEEISDKSPQKSKKGEEVVENGQKGKGKKKNVAVKTTAEDPSAENGENPMTSEVTETKQEEKTSKKKEKKKKVADEVAEENYAPDEIEEVPKKKGKKKKAAVESEPLSQELPQQAEELNEEPHKKKKGKKNKVPDAEEENHADDRQEAEEVNEAPSKKKGKKNKVPDVVEEKHTEDQLEEANINSGVTMRKKNKKTAKDTLETDLPLDTLEAIPQLPEQFLTDLAAVKPHSRIRKGQQLEEGKPAKKAKELLKPIKETEDFIPLEADGATRFAAVPNDYIDSRAAGMVASDFKKNMLFGDRIRRAPTKSLTTLAKKRAAAAAGR